MNRYSLPELPYKYSELEPLYSAETLELHYSKHHAGYVKGANETLDMLDEARDSGAYSTLNQLQKNLAFHVSGHIMHSIFWTCMSANGGGEPGASLGKKLADEFGSVDALREQMTAAATSLQGSGWVALSWEAKGQGLIVEQVFDHQGNTGSASTPLLVIDCWEHAYYLQYRNEKAKWLKAFWDLVDWGRVEKRISAAEKIDPASLG